MYAHQEKTGQASLNLLTLSGIGHGFCGFSGKSPKVLPNIFLKSFYVQNLKTHTLKISKNSWIQKMTENDCRINVFDKLFKSSEILFW